MADPDSLIKGNCYFDVGYVDTDLFIPVIDTIIFIEFVDDQKGYWLFQDAGTFASGDSESDLIAITEDKLYSVLDISELRSTLKGMLHLHPIHGNATNREVKLTEKNRAIIAVQVDRIFKGKNPEDSRTITTNYRDKGVSIQYNQEHIEITMFTGCKEQPEEEAQIRNIFRQIGASPLKDYLSQHERIRILSYSLKKPPTEISDIICDIFLKAYKIMDNEKIDSHYRL